MKNKNFIVFFAIILLSVLFRTNLVMGQTDPIDQALTEISRAQRTSDYLGTTRGVLMDYLRSTPTPLLCARLALMPTEDLIILGTALQEAGAEELSCWPKIEKQIQRYFRLRLQEFNQKIVAKELPTLRPVVVTENYPLIKYIDNNQGGFYINVGMPKGYVALTFDDGPHPTRSRAILKILEEHQVQATFFFIGNNAKKYKSVLQEISADGHSYGSHTVTHADLTTLSFANAKKEILTGHQIVTDITGQEMRFFRFPYGAMNASLQKFVKEQRMANFFWSIDSLDWKITDPTKLLKKIFTDINAKQRGIILMHDIHQQSVIVLPQLLQALQEQGYKVVNLRPYGT